MYLSKRLHLRAITDDMELLPRSLQAAAVKIKEHVAIGKVKTSRIAGRSLIKWRPSHAIQ